MENCICKCGLERNCKKELVQLLRLHRGRQVQIMTSDGARYCGTAVLVHDDGIEILDRSPRLIFIPFMHFEAVIEPQMELTRICGRVSSPCGPQEECACGEDDSGGEESSGEDDSGDQRPAPLFVGTKFSERNGQGFRILY